jgi:N-acetylglutamate synthase-like GNAT family acetyltransferase
MNPPSFQARRATLDDLPGLRSLWQVEQLDAELEKRVGEFQVVLDAQGQIVGAMALQVDGLHGKLHSEAFKDFGLADMLRPMLWERIQTVSKNRGLVRLWTLESTLFWRGLDFQAPTPDLLEKFPARLGDPAAAWLTLKLKDELLANLTPEQEFKLFKDAAQAEAEETMRQARILKGIALALAIAFLVIVGVVGFYLIRYIKYKDRYGAPPSVQPAPAPAPKQ